jgi:hypothetical protein
MIHTIAPVSDSKLIGKLDSSTQPHRRPNCSTSLWRGKTTTSSRSRAFIEPRRGRAKVPAEAASLLTRPQTDSQRPPWRGAGPEATITGASTRRPPTSASGLRTFRGRASTLRRCSRSRSGSWRRGGLRGASSLCSAGERSRSPVGLCSKGILFLKEFCSKRILFEKNFVRKEFCSKIILFENNFVRKEFCSKWTLFEKNFVRKESFG